jgi:hypothetical protein
MRTIYKLAKRVLAWLGPARGESDLAMKHIKIIGVTGKPPDDPGLGMPFLILGDESIGVGFGLSRSWQWPVRIL